ncbi:MAG: hypothetical protein K9N51_09060 [Candidatus Pacebacteria bacterium]|nr:hypothetical protein [Candidatus Paceibacterota bacterium]
MMTGRERFLCALHGERPDRVPWAEFCMGGDLLAALDEELGCGAFPEGALGAGTSPVRARRHGHGGG